MNSNKQKINRFFSTVFVIVFAFGLLSAIVFSHTKIALADTTLVNMELKGAEGLGTCFAGPFSPTCVPLAIKEAAKTVGEKVATPAWKIALVQGMLDIGQFVTNRLAYESALIIANGGIGQGSMFYKKGIGEGFADFGLEVAGEAVAEMSETLESGLGLKLGACLPPPDFTLALQLGIAQRYKPQKPRCDINEFMTNWTDFYNEIQSAMTPGEGNKAILSKFAESLQPGRNELSAAVKINYEIAREVDQEKNLSVIEQLKSNALKPVKDTTTGQVTTPASFLEDDFITKLRKLATGEDIKLRASDILAAEDSSGAAISGLALTAASTFTNTLLSELFNKIYKGLFAVSPESSDPFNLEALPDDEEAQRDRLSGIFATLPFATTEYNALTEFIVCPPQGIANRGINNCVMNANFMATISRGNTGIPLTVQEAIDEGLIDGSWKLISSRKLDVNQDPLCYTYSFCYANLVKMRKARILPIGWELAAQANSDTNPKSLKEIISEFNNCGSNGTIDAAHPFCHLIDPDWVLKYPDAQCRAIVNGEIRLTMLSPGRQSVCSDAPSCLGEDGNGKCTNGYGYCVSEKNVWRFKGDACAQEYAGCLSMTNTTTKKQNAVIINTVDYSVCGKDNAGCQWYRTNKYEANEAFEWLIAGESFNTADREDDWRYQTKAGSMSDPATYNPPVGNSYAVFAYEDRQYFTHAAEECSNSDAGCSELFAASGSTLNMVRDPSFETDDNSDSVPDHWTLENIAATDLVIEKNKSAARGTSSIILKQGNGKGLGQLLSVSPNQFYTLSYYAVSETASAQSAGVRLTFLDKNSAVVSLSGLSFVGCTANGNELVAEKYVETEWARQSCTFGVPKNASQMKVLLDSTSVRYDAIQIEPKETTSTFVDGLKKDVQAQYIKTAPSYLGCEGKATDPSTCNAYAQVCASQDVGCNLYTPDDGDPAVSAIVSSLDACPNECVGYDAFKQEATLYDDGEFPVHFIPAKAVSCSAQYVGCDSFTNLNKVGEGGEGIEYYTTLRACATPQMTDGSTNKESSTFFTWEGSDNAGYQLRSWVLLESNENDAPCTKWKVSAKDQMICEENAAYLTVVSADQSCNDHSDILSNPDCREFYDASGIVHYRLFSKTVTISAECAPYRKDVSAKSDCDASGGFWDLQVGFCRYFGLSSESNSCPSAQNGCRSYTGGAGRNAVTLLNEKFESGSYAGFEKFGSANTDVKISNESIATDGHSLRVQASAGAKGGFATVHSYLHPISFGVTYDPSDSNTSKLTCTDLGHTVTPAGCEIAPDCVVYPGANSCGQLVNKLVSGKTFTVQFWAKGNGNLQVSVVEYGGGISSASHNFDDSIALTGNWKVYSLGPFDSSQYSGIEKNSILAFQTDAGKEFFIDNLIFKQVEENITVVKNSWVVPSTCDTAPNGAITPQYYLGCEAYTDKDGGASNLYQFSNLCEEKVVGCEAFYQTFESDSPYQQVFNARCSKGTLTGTPQKLDLAIPSFVTQNTACGVGGKTYCTISTGRSFCAFDYDGTFGNKLPIDGNFGIVFGPETVLTPADRATYLVDNGKADCDAGAAGCKEVGLPKYSQDLKKVEGFDSAYFINDPEKYEDILCDNDALFCDEFASTKDGNFYFKDPIKKTCEYRAGVEIEKQKFSGWFRSGTSEPCYWSDLNNDAKFNPKTDKAYIVAGDQAEIWQNGDLAYDGWVGSCPSSSDLCTEFADITDNEKPYYFLNNDKLDESATADPDVCDGSVSQKLGCAVFNNRSRSELKYNASASYVVSIHADELLNQSPNALIDPVSCTLPGGGEFTLSDGTTKVDLCKKRCEYQTVVDDALETSMSQLSNTANTYYERSCFSAEDCPTLETKNGKEIKATGCVEVTNDTFKLENDSNTVLRVVRDRSCSSWLACDSSRTSWNEQNNKYERICDSVNLCTEGGALGNESTCTKWSPRDPEILTAYQYSKRDTTWSGSDLSGYAIPNKLPVELYNQFNTNPAKACEKDGVLQLNSGFPVECGEDKDCANGYKCKTAPTAYRLVNDAGPCSAKAKLGSSCQVGFCENGGEQCGTSADCGKTDKCVIGSCQATAKAKVAATFCIKDDCSCALSTDCKGNYVCDAVTSVCVDKQLGAQNCYAAADNNCDDPQVCVPNATAAFGSCFSGRCLTSIVDTDNNGFADPLKSENYVTQSCRGYPEIDSPYTQNVVEQWATANGTEAEPEAGFTPSPEKDTKTWSRPYTYKTGYQDSQICAPQGNGKFANCNCSYDKVEYADGTVNRYEEVGTSTELPDGFCAGGAFDGHICKSDNDCADQTGNSLSSGSCLKRTRRDTMFGWDGYCIEKDSSIQLYASTDPKDQACLTWLPVDQLSGATDLYAKYLSAGFEPQDTYFCGEIGLAYDFNTNGYHCAETDGGNCDDSASKSAFQDDDPDEDTYCASGSFVIMGPCGNAFPGDICEESWGDDDYPYFCVPELSYKKEDDKNGEGWGMKKGERCAVPEGDEVIYSDSFDVNGNRIYFMNDGPWSKYKASYNNCMVRGIFTTASESYNAYFGGSSSGISVQPYAACRTIVQVGQQKPDEEGNYNAAWTDRVWKSKPDPFSIKGDFPLTIGETKFANAFAYKPSTVPEIFGQAFGLTKKLDVPDPYPHRAYMCRDDNGKGDSQILASPYDAGLCADDYALDGVGEARPYYGAELSTPTTVDTSLCQNFDCSCSDTQQCNYDNIVAASVSCGGFVCKGGDYDGANCDEALGKKANAGSEEKKECDDLPDGTAEEKANKKQCFEGISDIVCGYTKGKCEGKCVGGLNSGVACNSTIECEVQECSTYSYIDSSGNTITGSKCSKKGEPVLTSLEVPSIVDLISSRLKQLFAFSYDLKEFNDDTYVDEDGELVKDHDKLEENSDEEDIFQSVFNPGQKWLWDERAKEGKPPTVVSLGACAGTKCKEGKEGAITVNEQDEGDILAKGSKRASVSFFTYANSDQMPIRNIIVDWGDGEDIIADGMSWPTDSQSGSNAIDNFYKNHRGLNPSSGNEICSSSADEFGKATEACSSGYVVFSHDYSCSQAKVKQLETRACVFKNDGRLENSPCLSSTKEGTAACVFQPRVHVKDNWGWCTGFCNAGSDGSEGCYAGTPPDDNGECQINVCPSEGKNQDCPDGGNKVVNPWVNYDGTIIVEVE